MAATRVGLIGTDDYLNEWHRETRACGDDLDAEAAAGSRAPGGRRTPTTRSTALVRAGGLVAEEGDL